jgi:hypothetical protein
MTVGVVAALLASQANAARLSGNKLHEYCTAPESSMEGVACTLYIEGYAAGIEAGDGSKKKDARMWCFPPNSTVGQGKLIVQKYMRDNPAMLHHDADLIVGLALMQAFPCP